MKTLIYDVKDHYTHSLIRQAISILQLSTSDIFKFVRIDFKSRNEIEFMSHSNVNMWEFKFVRIKDIDEDFINKKIPTYYDDLDFKCIDDVAELFILHSITLMALYLIEHPNIDYMLDSYINHMLNLIAQMKDNVSLKKLLLNISYGVSNSLKINDRLYDSIYDKLINDSSLTCDILKLYKCKYIDNNKLLSFKLNESDKISEEIYSYMIINDIKDIEFTLELVEHDINNEFLDFTNDILFNTLINHLRDYNIIFKNLIFHFEDKIRDNLTFDYELLRETLKGKI